MYIFHLNQSKISHRVLLDLFSLYVFLICFKPTDLIVFFTPLKLSSSVKLPFLASSSSAPTPEATNSIGRSKTSLTPAGPEEEWTCPWPHCSKTFRKESLVDYHVKYYHTEDGTPVQPNQPRKRKKTTSICEFTSLLEVLEDILINMQ